MQEEKVASERGKRRAKQEHKTQREEEKAHREWNKRRNAEQRRVKRKQRQAAGRLPAVRKAYKKTKVHVFKQQPSRVIRL